jgi:hypothetical protein
MMMALGTWRVKVKGRAVGLALIRLSAPRYVPAAGPKYGEVVRRITEFASSRPKLNTVKRYFFATDKQMERIARSVSE